MPSGTPYLLSATCKNFHAHLVEGLLPIQEKDIEGVVTVLCPFE